MPGVELVAGQRQPPQHHRHVLVEVEEPGRDRVSGRRDERRDARDGASGQLERQERIALREVDDPVDDLAGARDRGARGHERRRILSIEWLEVDLNRLAGPRQPRHSPDQCLGRRLRAIREHRRMGFAGGADVLQHVDRRLVGEVRVVDDQHDRRAVAGRQQQAANRPDHLVASERLLGRSGRRACRGQLAQHRAAAATDCLEQRWVTSLELLGDVGERCIGAARLGGGDGDHDPLLSPRQPPQLPAERRLADARRATHDKHAARFRPQLCSSPRELELATDEPRLADPESGDALVVDGLGLGARRDPQLAAQGVAQPPVPADRGRAIPRCQLAAHQLAVSRLVGRLNLHQALPLPASSQQLYTRRSQVLARRLGPLLVARFRQQLAGICRRGCSTCGVAARPKPHRPRPRSGRRRFRPTGRETEPPARRAARRPRGRPAPAARGRRPCAGSRRPPRRPGGATTRRSPGRARADCRRRAPEAARARPLDERAKARPPAPVRRPECGTAPVAPRSRPGTHSRFYSTRERLGNTGPARWLIFDVSTDEPREHHEGDNEKKRRSRSRATASR